MRLTFKDKDVANRIIHHPDIYPMISDDFADPHKKNLGTDFLRMDYVYLLHPNKHTLFLVTPRTFTLFECHTMIEPEGRGPKAVKAAMDAAKWIFENTTCQKVMTYVPHFNRPAKLFALMVGMKNEGICTKSFLKDGRLHDQWVLGLEKEAFLCQQLSQ